MNLRESKRISNEKVMPPYTTSKSLYPKFIWFNSRIKLKFKVSCLKQEDKAAFTSKNVVNYFIVYELDTWPWGINTYFTLKNCLFGSVKITKNVDPDKYKHSVYNIGFGSRSFYLLPNNTTRRNVSIFRVDMILWVHIDNKGKDMLIPGDGPTQGLDDTTLTAKAIYSIKFTESNTKILFKFVL